MPTVKIVTKFRDTSGHSFSETHYKAGGSSPDLKAILDAWRTGILPLRRELLGNDTVIVSSRASYPRFNDIASRPDKFFLANTVNTSSASEAVSLAVLMSDLTNTKKKVIHLRGMWDIVIQNGEYHPEFGDSLGWTTKFNAWKDALIVGQYGWATKTSGSAKGDVTNYVIETDRNITFTLSPQAGSGDLPTDKPISIRFGRLSKGRGGLNRTLIVKATSNTTVKTVAPIAAFPFSTQGIFNWRTTDFVLYNNLVTVSAGKRSQGRNSDLFLGRQSALARG